MLAAAWAAPSLNLSIRAVSWQVALAALLRTAALVFDPRPGPRRAALVTASLAADTWLLTGVLDITGGAFNPFIVVYAVYVWIAAVTLSRPAALLVGVGCAAAFGWLVRDHLQTGGADHHRLTDFPTHLFAIAFAIGSVAELVAHYVANARLALAQRQRLLDAARERAARSERLAALTTLAAGAAHELSTPLSTIAIAARELQHRATRLAHASLAAAIGEDAQLIRTEVDRCRAILDGMSGRATMATPLVTSETASAGDIAALAVQRLGADRQARLQVEHGEAAGGHVSTELVPAVASLLKNAFDASPATATVQLRVTGDAGMARFEVCDRGGGMSAEVRRRAGEPFFTTKEPGQGMGLGLFLARTIVERLGGSLRFESGIGTTAILEVPAGHVHQGVA